MDCDSTAVVTGPSVDGFSLHLGKATFFVRYPDFPWFQKATPAQIAQVEWPSPNHLYWPALDVDLSVESIRRPAEFPLLAKATD